MFGARVSIEIDLRQALDIETTLIASDRLCKQYNAIVGPEHPDTLESKSQFGRASAAAGNYRDAVNSLSRVVDKSQLVALLDIIANGYGYLHHPDLILSLEDLAAAFMRGSQPDFAVEIQETHTLQARYDLANTYRAAGRAKEVEIPFEEVANQRRSALGADHPDTLAAERGWPITKHDRQPFSGILRAAADIADKQREKLGRRRHHSETLRTLYVLLGVQLMYDGKASPAAMATCRELLAALRDPEVLAQRLAESLKMEEKVVEVYFRAGDKETSHAILQTMADELEDSRLGEGMDLQ
ncbi:hypothetical protein PG984_005146 [Apiospora sp. TS-2023a]